MQYSREFTEMEEKLLKNDLLNVTQWIDEMIAGKVSKCLSRAANEEKSRLLAEEATSMPVNELTLATNLFAREDYLNRAEREAAE